jgi:hypothetical protein
VKTASAAALLIALTPLACGSDPAGKSSGALGVCVEDPRSTAGCQTSWTLVDDCSLAASAASLEVAVFADQCPNDAALSAGDTSAALRRVSGAPTDAFAPVGNLELVPYGFAFLLRDQACHVIAWGCTEADLAGTTQILTSVKNWGAADECAAASTGACAATETCASGVCQ